MLTKFIRLTHKYLGILLAIFFVIWFLSGIVMVFVPGFPRAPKGDPLASAISSSVLPIDSLVDAALGPGAAPKSVVFRGKDDRSLVVIKGQDTTVTLDATSALPFVAPTLTPTEAASLRCHAPIERIDTLSQVDQWIPFDYYEEIMPIYKFRFADKARTEVYVTGDGQVIQLTTKASRTKAWFGTIPHFIYFTFIRKHQTLWTELITWAALLGCLMALTGIIIAIIDWARHGRRTSYLSIPYRRPLWRWHFILGLLFGWACITFAFSGYMSLAPLPDFLVKERTKPIGEDNKGDKAPRGSAQMRHRNLVAAGVAPLDSYALSPAQIFAQADSVEALTLKEWDGHPYYTVEFTSSIRHIDATDSTSLRPFILTPEMVAAKTAKTFPGITPEVSVVTEYDSEYFSRTGRMTPLPAIRVAYPGDELNTVEYYDPNGLTIRRYDDNSRLHSLLYGKLHRLGFKCLTDHLWLWYTVMLITLIGGAALSITGLIMALQWLGRRFHIGQKKHSQRVNR